MDNRSLIAAIAALAAFVGTVAIMSQCSQVVAAHCAPNEQWQPGMGCVRVRP